MVIRRAARFISSTGFATAFDRIHEAQSRGLSDYALLCVQASRGGGEDGVASTGWETMLEGLLDTGFVITGTWPMRTEQGRTYVAIGTERACVIDRAGLSAASRRQPRLATRKEFTTALRAELPEALRRLQSGSIAPVDLAQAQSALAWQFSLATPRSSKLMVNRCGCGRPWL